MANWSTYQEAIFAAIGDTARDAPHLAIRARAGSGKTTTGVHGLSRTPRNWSTLALAFNADIAKVLSSRVPSWCAARTFHSAGFAAVRAAFGNKLRVDKDRTLIDAQKLLPKALPSYRRALVHIVSAAKNTLTESDTDALDRLALRYEIAGTPEPWAEQRLTWCQDAAQLLRSARAVTNAIDFDDMCWLPIVLDLPMRTWDFVLADEAQDLNACQHALVKRLVGARGRLCAVGDDRQAIYGFRGVDTNSFDAIANHFDTEVLPLPICYRCDAAIVNRARRVVPDLEARPGAPTGIVRESSVRTMLADARPGDFILSRTRAPLLIHCAELITRGIPAAIVGSDIAANLIGLVQRSRAQDLVDLLVWLDAHQMRAADRLRDDPNAYDEIADSCDCLRTMARLVSSVDGLVERLRYLFRDGTNGMAVKLSTTHKAKGLETDRVWMLEDTFLRRPGIEEENLWYVATTRAKHELISVRDSVRDGARGGTA